MTSAGIATHVLRTHKNDSRFQKSGNSGNVWNKGLTKEIDDRCKRPDLVGKRWGSAINGHTVETKEKISAIMSHKMKNRYTASKREVYKGIKFESSWEVRLAKSLDKNSIKWNRPECLLWIDDNGQKHRYYPDFYLPDFSVYLDPKNPYVQKLDKRKFELVAEQNNVKLFMLNELQLEWDCIKEML